MLLDENETVVSVRFGELWLRGNNRGQYIKRLISNISARLSSEDVKIIREYDRVLLRLGSNSDINAIQIKLSTIFGISRFELSQATKPELKSIKKLAAKFLSKYDSNSVVRIQSHRSYKGLNFNSMDVISEVAEHAKKRGIAVSNRNFNAEININITKENAFISTGSTKGAGGLPIGSSGKAVLLLSGGIDSPVAAWYAMKRGLMPIYVHMYGYPDASAKELSKITDIASKLNEYSLHYKMYLVPSHYFQLAAIRSGRYETVLMKHFMLLVAQKIAAKEGAQLIYTGDSIGQVASQTPMNLFSEGYLIKYPIIRPLSGFDKEEIIKVARQIGTYELSLLPYMDVCSINSKNPSTAALPEVIKSMSSDYKLKRIAGKSVKHAQILNG